MEIQAIANINNKLIECTGEINIHWIKGPQAYITWKLLNGNNLIASKSENLYYKEGDTTRDDLINRTAENIKNYTIARKKIFKHVEILSCNIA